MIIMTTHHSKHDSIFEVPVMAGCGCAGANSLEQRLTVRGPGHCYSWPHTNRDIKAVKSQVLFMFWFL